MVSFTILAGGYDTFIAAYLFNESKGSLAITSRSPTGQNPSWLTLHPSNSSVLYVVNEIGKGALQSFSYNSAGVLSAPVETVSSGGDSPAFAVALGTGQVAVVNYGGANGRVVPTSSPLEFEDDAAPVITFPPPAKGVSHPHQVVAYRDQLLVPDLGADTVWRLTQNGGPGKWKISGSLPQPLGSGPRHVATKGDRLFVLHEISSTLSVQAIPSGINATSSPIATVSILPSDIPANTTYAAAELIITEPSAKFPKSYIYASNRNVGATPDPRGDSIAIFEHVNEGTPNEGFKLINQAFTGLSQVRGMAFGPKGGDDEYLVAAGVAGTGGTAVFQRVDGGKNLVEVARNKEIATRTSFVWI